MLKKGIIEEYYKKLVLISKNHFKRYGNKKMSLEELDSLCNLK